MTDSTPASSSPTPGPATPAGRGRLRTFGLPAAGFAVGIAAGLFLVGPLVAKSKRAPEPAHEETAHEGDSAAARGRAIHVVDNIVLNPAHSGGTRFLLLAVAAEVDDGAIVDELKARDAEVRDVLLRVVGAQTVERLTNLAVRDSLRLELADSLSGMLGKRGAVRRVYFPQFVVQ